MATLLLSSRCQSRERTHGHRPPWGPATRQDGGGSLRRLKCHLPHPSVPPPMRSESRPRWSNAPSIPRVAAAARRTLSSAPDIRRAGLCPLGNRVKCGPPRQTQGQFKPRKYVRRAAAHHSPPEVGAANAPPCPDLRRSTTEHETPLRVPDLGRLRSMARLAARIPRPPAFDHLRSNHRRLKHMPSGQPHPLLPGRRLSASGARSLP